VDHEDRPETSQVPYRGQPTKDKGTESSGITFDLAQQERKLIPLYREHLEMMNKGMLSTHEKVFDLGSPDAKRSQKYA